MDPLRITEEVLPYQQADTLFLTSEPGIHISRERYRELQEKDEELTRELEAANRQTRRYYSSETGLYFYSPELTELARDKYDTDDLARLERFLSDKGTLDIPVIQSHIVAADGSELAISIMPVTRTAADGANHGDMSRQLYFRDEVQAADTFMELALRDPDGYGKKYGEKGRQILVSKLHLMSTPSQLGRFDNVIYNLREKAGQAEWPYISVPYTDLAGEHPNKWRNIQDSFQMLTHTTLDAIDRGFLKPDELTDAHREFLSSVVPFLEAVGFPKYESSGSWEENPAVKSSVMAVETAMFHKMKTMAEKDDAHNLDFLAQKTDGNLEEKLNDLILKGLYELGRRLPYESPDYDEKSDPMGVKYREADATLVYVLTYGTPQLLAEYNIPMAANGNKPMTAREIEDMILEQLSTLIDSETNGMIRYKEDPYEGENYHTPSVQEINSAIKEKVNQDALLRGGEVDLDEKQYLRKKYTPKGKEAGWMHPLVMLGEWAAKRAIEAQNEGDEITAEQRRNLSTICLNTVLSTVTGEDQVYIVKNNDGEYEVAPVEANMVSECYVRYRTPGGEAIVVPSSFTPLNWAVAKLIGNIGLLNISTRHAQSRAQSELAA